METSIKADMVLSSNAVFTGLEDKPINAVIAIKGNKIIAIGSQKEVASFIGSETKRYDFKDELIMPGFNDFHIHLEQGSLSEYCADLSGAASEQEAVDILKKHVMENDNNEIGKDKWILGFGWYHVFWDEPKLPHRSSIDKEFPDNPVCLLNSDVHGAWLNSKGLEILGINRDTPDPHGGKIIKDENGEPTGVLDEKAINLAESILKVPLEQHPRFLKKFLEKAAEYGVTSVTDVSPLREESDLDYIKTCGDFEKRGELTARIHFSYEINGELDYPKQLREKYKSEMLKFTGLKGFLDGVPATYTAYLLDPYHDNPSTSGEPLLDPKEVKNWVKEADKEGFRVRFHACGDGAIRLALDCYDLAQQTNGKRDSRHSIEHVETVKPDDLDRFSELGVIASMQPEHVALFEKFSENTYPSRLGPNRAPYFPIKTLMNHGATLAFGSDFPIVSLNPMYGVYRGITRVHNDGEPKGGWFPEEKISLAETLRAYTLGGAYGNFEEDQLGTLEAGKLADIIVLNRNLFDVEASEILNSKVKLTIVDGKVVYSNLGDAEKFNKTELESLERL
ncbi:amidohydrolase [Scopulibacillus cellulosilyticus]|uniref:Amidohydrolase n=1 Tax=Scopulibacillus cellulosilyticus TaxID=2665665 RepID=A0ABW2PX09_9BACL